MSHPTDVPCPTCNASPGTWCTVGGMRRAAGPHSRRVAAHHVALGSYRRIGRIEQNEAGQVSLQLDDRKTVIDFVGHDIYVVPKNQSGSTGPR